MRGLRLGALLALTVTACGSSPAGGPTSDGGRTHDGGALPDGGPQTATTAVLERGGNPSHTAMYVVPSFTRAAAAGLHRDTTFSATFQGPVYAQLLYAPNGPSGKTLILAATEQNEVIAFDAAGGSRVWSQTLGTPATMSDLSCGNISPLGITGTPVIDAARRTVYLDTMIRNGARNVSHKIWALSLDDGTPRAGWPLDLGAVRAGSLAFDSSVQNQRGGLTILDGTVYVPYGGHYGDCGEYHGWVVGVAADDPMRVGAVATRAQGGGIWAPGGIANDGLGLFVATGNTFGAADWSDGEAILFLGPGPTFTGAETDFFAPSNWPDLDRHDTDIGGTAPILVDVPGANPSQLTIALGKDGNAYLLDRENLGGVGGALKVMHVASGVITSAATYTTAQGTYVVFNANGAACPGTSGNLVALRISPAAPPELSVAWCARFTGRSGSAVTTTDGSSEAIVWVIGASGDNRLHGFDGDTGATVFSGGANSPTETIPNVHYFQVPIAVDGRIFVAGSAGAYAFTVR
jgi:hypothetical protein